MSKIKEIMRNISLSVKNFFLKNGRDESGLNILMKSEGYKTFLSSIISIVIGLIIGFIIIMITDFSHSGVAITQLISGGFNAVKWTKGIGEVLLKTTPLLLSALSIIFAYKCGLFNIGAPGQYVIGLMFAFLGVFVFKLNWYWCMLLSVIGGALWGVIPGFFKAYLNVNEVITSIMFNWIGLYLMNYVSGAELNIMFNKDLAEVKEIPINSRIPILLEGLFNYKYVTYGIVIAIVVTILVTLVLNKTKFGYEIKATGLNKHAAKYSGMKYRKNILLTMAISGGLAGLASSCYYLTGYEVYSPVKQTVLPTIAFSGIAVAFLGGINPIGAVFSSLFITHITVGGNYLDTTYYSKEVSDLITAIIIYLCAFSLFIKQIITKMQNRNKKPKNNKYKNIDSIYKNIDNIDKNHEIRSINHEKGMNSYE